MVETRERPLSLSYRRPADRSEKNVLRQVLDGLRHDPQSDLAEVGSGFGLGLISLLFIGPVALLAAWALQFATGMTFGTDQTWLLAALLWLGGWGGMSALRVAARRGRTTALRRALVGRSSPRATCRRRAGASSRPSASRRRRPCPSSTCSAPTTARSSPSRRRADRPRARRRRARRLAAPSDAVLVRGSRSGILISENYSGPALPLLDVQPLKLAREDRPAHGGRGAPLGWRRSLAVGPR
jgi:hypothetical protein